MTKIKQPAITYMLQETMSSFDDLKSKGWGYTGTETRNTFSNGYANFGDPLPTRLDISDRINRAAYFDGYNAAFIDGYVKWVKTGTEQPYVITLRRQPTDSQASTFNIFSSNMLWFELFAFCSEHLLTSHYLLNHLSYFESS